jgi:fluoroacetyl-CoA thioesterase
MPKPIPIGARGEAEETVEFQHTLTARHAELPPIYSTPDMIRLMEIAAFHALQPYCEGDEISVGTAINIRHRAASGIGTRLRAEAVLESFDGRFYTLQVTVRDDNDNDTDNDRRRVIGHGTVGRAIVSMGNIMEKIKDQQKPSGRTTSRE